MRSKEQEKLAVDQMSFLEICVSSVVFEASEQLSEAAGVAVET